MSQSQASHLLASGAARVTASLQHLRPRGASIAIVALGGAAVYATRFLAQALVAFRFGAGQEYDAYNVALVLPHLSALVLAGSLEKIFLPVVAEVRARSGSRSANAFANTVLLLAAVLLAALSALGIVLAPQLISRMTPGLAPGAALLATRMARIFFVAIVPMGVAVIAAGTYHLDDRFASPALADAARALAYFLGACLLTISLGIVGLALSFAIAAFVKALVLMASRGRVPSRPRLAVDSPALITLGRLWLPLIGVQLLAQIYPVIDRYYGSLMGTGTISCLAYALAIAELPNTLIGHSVGVVFFPALSRAAAAQDLQRLKEELLSAIRIIAILGVPAVLWLAIVREPLLGALLQRGRFTAGDTLRTASLLLFYAGYTLGGMLGNVTSRVLWALKAVAFFLALSAINLAMYAAGIALFSRALGAEGIALAAAVVYNLSWIVQLVYIRVRSGPLGFAGRWRSIARYALCVLTFLATGLVAFRVLCWALPGQGIVPRLTVVGMVGIVACLSYWSMATWLGLAAISRAPRQALALFGASRPPVE